MPHFPKPFVRRARGLWYVQLHGKQINLGPDKDEAFRQSFATNALKRGLDALTVAILMGHQDSSTYWNRQDEQRGDESRATTLADGGLGFCRPST